MKYYIYASHSKINMLYSQIPVKLQKRIKADIKIDLKIFSTQFSQDKESLELTQKINVIDNYLNHHSLSGSSLIEKPYVLEKIPMSWGSLGTNEYKNAVWFCGKSYNNLICLLGSSNNLISMSSQKGGVDNLDKTSFSILPTMLQVIRNVILENQSTTYDNLELKEIASQVIQVNKLLSRYYLQQRLSFVAKVMLRMGKHRIDDNYYDNILIASPIYVALDE